MNYVYDILVNFNENLYEFYDWNLNDKVLHIRRIPIFKIESLNEIKNNIVTFEEDFLENIKNKTEYFSGRSVKVLKNAFLLTDGVDILGIQVGEKMKYSSLQIDEELDILDSMNFKNCHLNYKIVKPKKEYFLKTRYKIEQEKKIYEKINNLIKENNASKIKYLYYECFNKKESKLNSIVEAFISSLDNKEVFDKLYNFFELNKQIN